RILVAMSPMSADSSAATHVGAESTDDPSMAARQGATPPAWLHESRGRLLLAAIGGLRQNLDKLTQLVQLIAALFRPSLIRARLARLRDRGFVDTAPTINQLLVAARDQMALNAGIETKSFYASQGIPWGFHNLRRFLSGPATMMDPVGLFSPRDTLIHHVLQTFHRHPVYDLALLAAHEGGLDAMEAQADALLAGRHPHQAALASLIEDGSYHARLPRDIAAFRAAPHAPARDIPANLLHDAEMMLGMDQFKDLRGLCRYASRLKVGRLGGLRAWLAVAFDVTLGSLVRVRLGPRQIRIDACDPDLVARHLGKR
ncbi:MAG TPA: hypothetical protein VGF45_10270, partial [Polyangia bacterium]